MTPELRKSERWLVERVRKGDAEAWADLLAIYIPRIRNLAARWRIDEAAVSDIVLDKLEYAVREYIDGAASLWGYVKPLAEKALIDFSRKVENSRKKHFSDIPEHEEHGYGGRLAVNTTIEDVDTVFEWIKPHRELCGSLLYNDAPKEVRRAFRFYLMVRYSKRVINKSQMVCATGIADGQGTLFENRFFATLVDDYCLVGERILREISLGTAYHLIPDRIGEPVKLVKLYHRHWRLVAALVASGDEATDLVA